MRRRRKKQHNLLSGSVRVCTYLFISNRGIKAAGGRATKNEWMQLYHNVVLQLERQYRPNQYLPPLYTAAVININSLIIAVTFCAIG